MRWSSREYVKARVDVGMSPVNLVEHLLQIDMSRESFDISKDEATFISLGDDFVVYGGIIFESKEAAHAHQKVISANPDRASFGVVDASVQERSYWTFRYHNGELKQNSERLAVSID
jgi:hypothetical protein